MDKRVLLLKDLVKSPTDVLAPQTCTESFCGYHYPMAQKVFETKPGDEVEYLDHLVELGLLDRRVVDKVHLCPFCTHYAMNFREVCPRCDSPDIGIVDMIHHYQCGYVAPEPDFKAGLRYVCPKCSKQLRHIGIDYERPSTNYLCFSCGHIFSEPKISCLSLTCGQAFGVDKTMSRFIYAYRLTTKGTLAAERGEIDAIGFLGAFIDSELAVYTFRFFEEQLSQEIRRARRYKTSLCIVLVSPDNLDSYAAKFGKEPTASMFRAMAVVLKESLRDCDIPAVYKDKALLIILPDTPVQGAHIAAERIRNRIFELNPKEQEVKISVSIGLGRMTGEIGDAWTLIEEATKQMEEARRVGGNCVRPLMKV